MSTRRRIDGWASFLVAACLCLSAACASRRTAVRPELAAADDRQDVLAIADALEALIAAGRDTPADRQNAYDIVRVHEEDTAPSMYAKAAVTGRLVQQKGLLAADLVPEIERCARRSRDLDPDYRGGAATRLLGTLYVMAPAVLLRHGDSEVGIQLLEGLVERHPDVAENHLRLAEAYIALDDPAPAGPHLCRCLAHKTALRADDQILVQHLIDNVGLSPCVQTTVAPSSTVVIQPATVAAERVSASGAEAPFATAPMQPGDPRPAGRGTRSITRLAVP